MSRDQGGAIMDLRLGGFLNASMGGLGKIFLRVGSCVMVFPWVFRIEDTLVRHGRYRIATVFIFLLS